MVAVPVVVVAVAVAVPAVVAETAEEVVLVLGRAAAADPARGQDPAREPRSVRGRMHP